MFLTSLSVKKIEQLEISTLNPGKIIFDVL